MTLLVLLSACGNEFAQPSSAYERAAADLEPNGVEAAAVSPPPASGLDVGSSPSPIVADPAPTTSASERTPGPQRREGADARRETLVASPADTTEARSGAEPGSASDADQAADGGRADDHDVHDGADDGVDGVPRDDDGADDGADDEPQISARERTLAWLAEDPGVTFPAPTARTGAGAAVPPLELPEEPLGFARPDVVKGLYVNAWAAGSSTRSQALIDLATRTEINTFVIDLKDASGYVSYATHVMTAREAGADQEIRVRDLVALLERLQRAGIYPIARIVMVKDPLLIRARPEWAVQDTAGGVWVDSKGLIWANPHDRRVWDYHVELAKEAAAVGFPEIQWDYVRFADAPREDLERAVFPGADGRLRRDAVGAFLDYARAALEDSGVEMTLDVFGATMSAQTDVGIGQYWEAFIGSVDVALPMVYPSHYWVGSFGIQDPNGHPYEIVREALAAGLERSKAVDGAGAIRPWLQDFTLGLPLYGAPEVRAQIQATYDAGIDEWVLWNPSSRYTEDALEPAGGYPEGFEPAIRVGGRIVPLSERYAAMAAEAEERALARMLADSVAAATLADSLATVGDSLPTPGDSLAAGAELP